MSKCPSCYSEAQDGARFCAACGIPLDATSTPTREASQPATKAAAPARSSDPSGVHGRFVPGVLIGERYRIVGLLGRGGMGEVYRTDDLELGQSVALKFLPEKLAADPVALNRLRGEVRTARQIAHPNVCRVYDIAQVDGHVFLSMEYVDGDDLSRVLQRMGTPSKDKALEIARQLCLGLAAAHENKVLHRDLKPANVMLDGRGQVRITDFGLAGLADELEASPQRVGTPAYMAPEQLEAGTVSVRSDIYSLGLLLYELFTGKRAFEGTTLEELKRSHSSESVPSMQSQNESVDPAIESVVLRCLETDPAGRPPSVYAVLAGLPGGDPLAAALAAGETPSPDMVASARERGGLAPRWAVSLLAAVVITLGLGGVFLPKWTIAPEKSPDELGALAREMLRDLDHELPPGQASDLIHNTTYMNLVRQDISRGWVNDGQTWPPAYYYWHRANPVSLLSDSIHRPATRLDEPLAAPPGSVVIVLGSGGRLVELEVVPEPGLEGQDTPTQGVDWSLVLGQAGLDRVDLDPTAPTREVPAYCDEVAAFHVERSEKAGGDYVFQVCAHRGRVVHAATVWEWDRLGPLGGARQKHFFQRGGRHPLRMLMTAVHILSALLAWYNVKLGRGDRRGAILYGVVVFVAYLVFNASHARISESGIFLFLSHVVTSNPYGHAAMHAIHTTLLYLAIEPYVRRVWPGALIGWARLARGRWRDPAVAREVLMGMAAFLLGVIPAALVDIVVQALANPPVVNLYLSPEILGDTAGMMAEIPHFVALCLFFSMVIYFMVLVLRLLTRRDWATIALPLSALGLLMVAFLVKGGPSTLGFGITLIVLCASLLLVVMRAGLLATMVFLFVGMLWMNSPMTFDMSKFYAPQGLFGLLLLLAIAAYGFRYSLAGQPVLRNVLGGAAETGGGGKIR